MGSDQSIISKRNLFILRCLEVRTGWDLELLTRRCAVEAKTLVVRRGSCGYYGVVLAIVLGKTYVVFELIEEWP